MFGTLMIPVVFLWDLFWSIMGAILRLVWYLVQQIWLIKFIWVVLMTIANVFLMCISYYSIKRDYTLKNNLGFFILFFLLVVATLIFNRYLVDEILAFNVFLPIYLAIFVDVQGDDRNPSETMPRNLVFFAVVCAFL